MLRGGGVRTVGFVKPASTVCIHVGIIQLQGLTLNMLHNQDGIQMTREKTENLIYV